MLYNKRMQIFTELNQNNNLVLALGFFDGVHLGHQAVIGYAVDYAKKHRLKSAVLTFKNHPFCYFKGVCPKYIMQSREEFIATLGVDYFYEIDFDEKLANLSAEDYLENILVKHFSPKGIFTGFNHTFGAKKSGNAEFLKDNQTKFGYEYFEIPPQKMGGEVISSTKIRELLAKGDIELANKMLGRKFTLKSVVVEGQKLGRQLGFRTANILYPEQIVDIPFGVYEVETNFGKGIANFGIRPTVNDSKKPILETHILNFDNDIYGEVLEINFNKMIRRETKFASVEELKAQIKKDIRTISL